MAENKKEIRLFFRQINDFFKENDWSFGLIALTIVALILDSFGFKIMFEQNNLHGHWYDYLYYSIRVFGFDLQTPALDTPIPWVLELGRWLSGAATIWAVMLAVAHIFKDKWELYRKGQNHIVIIGVGSKGKTLGLDWLKKTKDSSHKDYGKLVVFIEIDKNNTNIDLLKDNGAIVIFGDAKDKEVLQKAKIEKASYLVTFTDSDATNMEIVSAITTMQNIQNKISCYVHLIHNEFYEFFRAKDFNNETSKLDIKIFNINSNSARILFGDKNHLLGANIFTDANKIKDKNTKVKIAIFGFGKLGENLLIHALQLGHFYNENPIEITVVYDNDKNENANLLDEFIKQYNVGISKGKNSNTVLEDYWKIKFIDDGEFLNENICEYSQIVIAYEDEFESLSNLMKLLKKYNDEILSNKIDIAIYSNSFASTAGVIQNDKDKEKHTVFKQVRTFGEIGTTCNYNIVINEELDTKAMLNNKQYNELHGYDDKNKTVKEEWQDLDMFLKDSNRYLMEHNEIKKYIISKLIESSTTNNDYEILKKSIEKEFFNYEGMHINWDKIGLKDHEYCTKLSKDEIVQLAKIEHKRWNAFHILNGWKSMSFSELKKRKKERVKPFQKNPEKKLHTCLVEWETLDEVSEVMEHNYKSDDIETIMRIPSLDKTIKDKI